jgi:glycosyltransferase involved in cell wall biosynthesis
MTKTAHITDVRIPKPPVAPGTAGVVRTRQAAPHATKPLVLHVVACLHLGGSEEVCLTIMRGLRSQFHFEVFAVKGISDCAVGQKQLNRAIEMGIPVYSGTRLPQKFGGMLAGGMALARVIKARRPALIHVHTEDAEAAYAVAATCAPSVRSIPLVRTIHNTTLWPCWAAVGRWCHRRMTRALVACVSQSSKEALIANWPTRGDPIVIYNGVAMEPRQRVAGKENELRLLFAGRFVDQKGAHLLPRIVRAIRPPSGCAYDLSIHGSGPHRPVLDELARNPPTGWRIRVDGPLPGLADALANVDLLLMPSLFEGLGLTAIEALLAGVPVVGTVIPGLDEVFRSDYPWLAVPGDAASFATVLDRAIAERARWPQVVRAEADRARRRFDVSVMCRAYANLYANAVAGAAAVGPANIGALPANDVATRACR